MKLINTSKTTLFIFGFVLGLSMIHANLLTNFSVNDKCENSCEGNIFNNSIHIFFLKPFLILFVKKTSFTF